MAKMMRCKADLRITVTGSPATLDLWPGAEVDFDRELAPGRTLAETVYGRETCFEPVKAEPDEPAFDSVTSEHNPWADALVQKPKAKRRKEEQ